MTDTFRDLIIRTSKDKEEAEFRIALHEALAEFAFDKNEEGKMVDDLVKRLRDRGASDTNCLCGNPVCIEAADRIEKLEAALAKIAQHDMQAIAMDALRPGERIRKALEGKDDTQTDL